MKGCLMCLTKSNVSSTDYISVTLSANVYVE